MIPSAYNRARRAGVAAALGSTGEATYSKRGGYTLHRPTRRGALPLRRVWLAAYERTIRRQPGETRLAYTSRAVERCMPGFMAAYESIVAANVLD